MKKIVINGKDFLKKNKRGVQRYTIEIISALDKYLEDIKVELLVPYENKDIPKFKNIKIKEFGSWLPFKGWQYIAYQYYIWKNNALGVSLSADVAPIFNPGIVAIHDMRFNRNREKIKGIKNFLKHRYKLYTSYLVAKNAKHIVTVSKFQKKEIERYYKIDSDKISVIYNAWEHLKNIKIDDNRLNKKYKNIIDKEFYFFLGGKEENKNLKWIVEVALKNKDKLFVMAGPEADSFNIKDNDININKVDNIKSIGYITDEEIAFFMKKCSAFIFPSIYEGFGIPPLEALCFGAKVLCANSSCLPEIYKNYVSYFDPYDYNIDLNQLTKEAPTEVNGIFEIYSWEKSAKKLLDLIKILK